MASIAINGLGGSAGPHSRSRGIACPMIREVYVTLRRAAPELSQAQPRP